MTYSAPVWAIILKTNMKHLQAVQIRSLRLTVGYDCYTRINKIHSYLEIIKLKSFMKHLDLILHGSTRLSRNRYVKRSVDNRRVQKPVHIFD